MKYYFAYKIQYQEVDTTHHLRLYTLENFLLNAAGRISDYLGYGLKYFLSKKLSWVITRLNLNMTELPGLSDIIVVETWVESHLHSISLRNYRIHLLTNPKYSLDDIDRRDHARPIMFDKANFRLIGEAKSYWTVLHLENRAIVNVFDDAVFAGAVDGEILNVPRVPRKPPVLDTSGQDEKNGERHYTVKYTDIDYNEHCNSCKYIEMMFNTFVYPNFQYRPFLMEINYRKELREGSDVTISYEQCANAVFYQIKDEQGDLCCNASFKFAQD